MLLVLNCYNSCFGGSVTIQILKIYFFLLEKDPLLASIFQLNDLENSRNLLAEYFSVST